MNWLAITTRKPRSAMLHATLPHACRLDATTRAHATSTPKSTSTTEHVCMRNHHTTAMATVSPTPMAMGCATCWRFLVVRMKRPATTTLRPLILLRPGLNAPTQRHFINATARASTTPTATGCVMNWKWLDVKSPQPATSTPKPQILQIV